MCDSCESKVDDLSHVLFCPSYAALREDKRLNNDSDLANYLQKVLDIRTNLRLNKKSTTGQLFDYTKAISPLSICL